MKSNWMRGDLAPIIVRKGVRGAMKSADKIRQILDEKAARTRRGNAAELLAEARREIERDREARRKTKEMRQLVDAAIGESVLEYPEARLKIKRDSKGNVMIQRRNKGKFIAAIKI